MQSGVGASNDECPASSDTDTDVVVDDYVGQCAKPPDLDVNSVGFYGSTVDVGSWKPTSFFSSNGTEVIVTGNCLLGICNCAYVLGGKPTQLKPCRFAATIFVARVGSVDDRQVFDYVVQGVDIVTRHIKSYECANYSSILQDGVVQKMDKLVRDELGSGALSITSTKPNCIHAIGAVMKPDGNVRPITDCSRPEGDCLNDNMEEMQLKFTYKSVDAVIKVLEKGDYMCTTDIKAAYRSVSVNPSHTTYQGLSWILDGRKVYLEDNRLCFGSRCGPFYFNKISEFIYQTLTERYGMAIVNYLDDFINISGSWEKCIENQVKIIRFLRFLGFFVSWQKVSPPSTRTVFLGLIIDSNLMELSLPPGKLDKMRNLVDEINGLDRVSKNQLDRLTGMLAHCSTIIKGGRTFCRSLYDHYRVMNKSKLKTVRLSETAKSDLDWWAQSAYLFNGKATIAKETCGLSPTSDASLAGFACIFGCDWFYGTWGDSITFDTDCVHRVSCPDIPISDRGNINVYELFPVYWAIVRWANLMANKRVTFTCDNMQVCFMLRTGRSVNQTCMNWLKRIF